MDRTQTSQAWHDKHPASRRHSRILHIVEDISEGPATSEQLVVGQLARHFSGPELAAEVFGPALSGRPVAACLGNYVRRPEGFRRSPSGLVALWDAIGSSTGVHIHGVWSPVGIAAGAMSRLRRVPYIVTPHGMLQPWLLRRRRWLKRMHLALASGPLIREAARVHCITPREARMLRRLGVPPDRVVVIPNSIPLDWPVSSPDRVMTLEREPVVLFVGRLHPVKGILPLLDAWLRLWPSFTDWRLQVVGPDPLGMQPSLEHRLRGTLGADAVQFLGVRGRADLVAIYDRASVFVLPSFTEVMGMANIEAAARGVPILTSRRTGLDLLELYGAGMVCSSTAESIAAGLQTLMSMPEMWRRRMGLAALRMAEEQLMWDRVAGQFEALYRVAFRAQAHYPANVS